LRVGLNSFAFLAIEHLVRHEILGIDVEKPLPNVNGFFIRIRLLGFIYEKWSG